MPNAADAPEIAARVGTTDLSNPDFSQAAWDWMSLCFMAILAIIAILTFRDYGITWDEEIQHIYGDKLLAYYGSWFHDRSVFSLDNLFYYGGLFEIAAALVAKVLPLGLYETRHLLCAFVGILGATGSWRLARLLSGPRAGAIALLLTALTPAYYGHSFFNPKDIPFACALIWALFFACSAAKEYPRPSARVVIGLGLTLGCALGVRVGGGLVLAYMAVAITIYGLLLAASGASIRATLSDAARFILRLSSALPIAYFLMAIFWPWSVQSLSNPFDALLAFSKMQWPGRVLMEGVWLAPSQLPFFYLPLMLLIRLPEVMLLGLVAATGLTLAWLGKIGAGDRPAKSLPLILLATSLLFPIAFYFVFRPNVFHGYRHFLFLISVAAVTAALAWDQVWTSATRRIAHLSRWFISGLSAAVLFQAATIASLFPDEYIYYNSLVGGVRGAAGSFETDYWGSSLREATIDLERFLKKEGDGKGALRRYSVAVVCANPLSASYFFTPFLSGSKQVDGADFVVERANADCSTPIAGHIVAQVKRSGVVLSTVIDRRRVWRER